MDRIPVIDMTATGININRMRVNAGLSVKDRAGVVPSTNRSGHRTLNAAMQGSNPVGITIYRIGVTPARPALTQAVVVQIHDSVPSYSPQGVPYASLAQPEEQQIFNPKVVGSIPSRRTIIGL